MGNTSFTQRKDVDTGRATVQALTNVVDIIKTRKMYLPRVENSDRYLFNHNLIYHYELDPNPK